MIGIYYGSSTGNTEAAANDIAAALGVDAANIHNVGDTDASTVADYDTLLLGSSTWGAGDLQDDWYDFLDNLKAQDLAGKKIGLFGCGDSDSYGDSFCGALAQIYDALQDSGATFVGAYEPEGDGLRNQSRRQVHRSRPRRSRRRQEPRAHCQVG